MLISKDTELHADSPRRHLTESGHSTEEGRANTYTKRRYTVAQILPNQILRLLTQDLRHLTPHDAIQRA